MCSAPPPKAEPAVGELPGRWAEREPGTRERGGEVDNLVIMSAAAAKSDSCGKVETEQHEIPRPSHTATSRLEITDEKMGERGRSQHRHTQKELWDTDKRGSPAGSETIHCTFTY